MSARRVSERGNRRWPGEEDVGFGACFELCLEALQVLVRDLLSVPGADDAPPDLPVGICDLLVQCNSVAPVLLRPLRDQVQRRPGGVILCASLVDAAVCHEAWKLATSQLLESANDPGGIGAGVR